MHAGSMVSSIRWRLRRGSGRREGRGDQNTRTGALTPAMTDGSARFGRPSEAQSRVGLATIRRAASDWATIEDWQTSAGAVMWEAASKLCQIALSARAPPAGVFANAHGARRRAIPSGQRPRRHAVDSARLVLHGTSLSPSAAAQRGMPAFGAIDPGT